MSDTVSGHQGKPTPTEVAVILAAGEGSRLTAAGIEVPKPLAPLLGMTLGERVMDAFLGARIERFVVVVGHMEEAVSRHFIEIGKRRSATVTIVKATEWKRGNGASALAASEAVGGRNFLLSMVDHIFSREMIEVVLGSTPAAGEVRLAIDKDREAVFDVDDLTKVTVAGEKITGIGKELKKWDAGDTGLFHCSAALFDGLRRAQKKNQFGLSDGIKQIIADGVMTAIDVTGHEWIDVDTGEAHAEAERRILGDLEISRPWIRSWLPHDR